MDSSNHLNETPVSPQIPTASTSTIRPSSHHQTHPPHSSTSFAALHPSNPAVSVVHRLFSGVFGEVSREYTLLPTDDRHRHRTESVSTTASSNSDCYGDDIDEGNMTTTIDDNEGRGRTVRRPRSFPETRSERRDIDDQQRNAVAQRRDVSGTRSEVRKQDVGFLDAEWKTNSRYAPSSHHTHANRSRSHFSQRTTLSHVSQRPSAIRRPTSTFIVGAEVKDDGPSIVEMKTALIQRAVDDGGMGRYQWCIFFLCGFGYALDLMWAQAFSLATPRIQQELGISDARYGDIFSVFSAGLTVGAFVWGILVDIIGRRWAFNLTVGIVAVFGTILGALNSWAALCGTTFFVGFGLGGNIPIDATIVLEFLPNNRRYLLAALSVFQPIGVIITSFLSWALIPRYACEATLPACSHLSPGTLPSAATCCTKHSNYGWRYALFTLGALSVLAFVGRFVLFTFHESPKFLVSKGRDTEAVEVLRKVRAFNRRTGWFARKTNEEDEEEAALTVEDLSACEREWEERESDSGVIDGLPTVAAAAVWSSGSGSGKDTGGHEDGVERKKAGLLERAGLGHLRILFGTWGMVRLTLLTWVCYAADYWGFVIAGNFLPKFLAERGAAADESTATTYRNYIIIAVVGVPGVLLGAALIEIPRFGRKWAMVVSSALMGTSLFLYAVVTTPAASVGFNAMEYFFQSTFNAVLYGWTPEAFPAAVRGSACGLASFWGRLTSIVAPLAAASLSGSAGVLYLAGGGVFLCTLTALFLPDTRESDVL